MRQTLSRSWKFLASKLHQPLPLNGRDSQKLLTVLNDSFKRNLDRQYPHDLAGSEHSPDDHINSLLKSPLFTVDRTQHPSFSGRQVDVERNALHIQELKHAVEKPVEYFERQVSSGTATLGSAKVALAYQMNRSLASAVLDPKESMKSSGVGYLMTNWLWSSGQYERLEFVRDRAFIARLMPFLVVGGQYKPIWEWLQRLRVASARHVGPALTQEDRSLQRDTGFLLSRLLRAEVTHGQGLQSAIQIFLTNLNSMRLSLSDGSPSNRRRIHCPGGAYLAGILAESQASPEVDDTIIYKFDRSVVSWTFGDRVDFYRALIQLSYPRKPNVSSAMQLLSRMLSPDAQISENERPTIVRIGLKTVDVLLAQGSMQEAAELMKSLQTKFALELGADVKSPSYSEGDQELDLRSLNLQLAT